MSIRSKRFIVSAGLILAVGLFVIFVLKESPAHMGHVEASAAPVPETLVPPSPTAVTVNIQNNAFSPSTVNITTGTAVHWIWVNGTHSATSGVCCTADGNWNSGVKGAGSTFDFTFSTPGTFPYFCVIHGQMMTGQVVVTAATATVSGKVLTPSGNAIRRSVVVLTDSNNVTRTVTANQQGFQFANVAVGQTYSITAQAGRFTCTPHNVAVSGNLTNENIICQLR